MASLCRPSRSPISPFFCLRGSSCSCRELSKGLRDRCIDLSGTARSSSKFAYAATQLQKDGAEILTSGLEYRFYLRDREAAVAGNALQHQFVR
jgi:hypothetical protein